MQQPSSSMVPVAKKRGRPGRDNKTGSVRIDLGIIDQARVIAAFRRVELSEYLSDLLRPIVQKQFDQTAKDMLTKPSGDA